MPAKAIEGRLPLTPLQGFLARHGVNADDEQAFYDYMQQFCDPQDAEQVERTFAILGYCIIRERRKIGRF